MYSLSTSKTFGEWKLTRVCWIFTFTITVQYKNFAFKHLLQFVQFACVNAVLLRQHTSLLECSRCHWVLYKVIIASFLRHGFEITKCLAFWNILAVSLTPTLFLQTTDKADLCGTFRKTMVDGNKYCLWEGKLQYRMQQWQRRKAVQKDFVASSKSKGLTCISVVRSAWGRYLP
jgi:hypothetical protein